MRQSRSGPDRAGLGASLLADITPLREDPAFRTIWIAQAGSAIGRETARIAIPLHAFLITGSATAIGLVAAAQLVGGLLLALGGGALADVVDRRRLMIVAQLAMMGTSGVLGVVAMQPDPSLLWLVVLAFVLAALAPLEHPARVASVARLVPAERLTAALALTSLNFQASSIIGPAIAGLLITAFDLPAAYALQAAGYGWASILSLRLPALAPASAPGRGPLALLLDGVRFVRRRRVVLSTFALDLNAMVFGLPVALLPVLAIDVFGAGPAAVGLLAASRGVGALLAAVLSGWMSRVQHPGRGAIAAVAMFSVATGILAVTGLPLMAAVVAIAVCGAADLISAVFRNSIVQATTPDELRGRVAALHGLVTTGGPRVGDVRAALMTDVFGAAVALGVGGMAALGGTVLVGRAFPQLGRFRAPEAHASGAERTPRPSRG